MDKVTWVHLSDFHFKTNQGPKGYVDDHNREVVLEKLLEDLKSFPVANELSIDFVVVTGDIVFSGKKGEYKKAIVYFDKVLANLNCPKSHIFFVPGNHDIDWMLLPHFNINHEDQNKITLLLSDDESKKLYFRKFNAYKEFVNTYLENNITFDYKNNYFWTKSLPVGEKSIRILGLNSAWNVFGSNSPNSIVIGEKQVIDALNMVKKSDMTVALMHHPLNILHDDDRKKVEKLLRCNCDFILHGHLHESNFRNEKTPDSQTIIIPAGASYQDRQGPNAYNYVRFDIVKKVGDIWFRSYDEYNYQWVADTITCPQSKIGKHSFSFCISELPPSITCIEDGIRIRAIPIYGRDNIISKVMTRLKERSIAVVGIKGIGKSKLLSAVFEKLSQNPPPKCSRLYWKRLDDQKPLSFTEFAKQIINKITGREVEFHDTDERSQAHVLIKILEDFGCYLIIDQFECVVDETVLQPKAGYLEFLIAADQTLKKARLLVSAWEVPNPLPAEILKGISDSAGLELAIFNSSHLYNTNDEALLRLLKIVVARLQGHPYAIELVMKSYNPQELRLMLEDQSLWDGGVKKFVNEIVSRVFNRIDNNNLKQILTTVCILGKPCKIETVKYIAEIPEESFNLLNELKNRSLINCSEVRKENDEIHIFYDTHVLVREYVISQQSTEEKLRLHRRAASFFLNESQTPHHNRESNHREQLILEAIHHLLLAGKPSEAIDIFCREKIHENLFCWRHITELKQIYELFLKSSIDNKIRSIFLGNLGMVYRDLLDYNKAKELYSQALDLARKSGSIESECCQLINLGDLHYYFGEIDTSIEYHQQAMEFFHKLNNKKLESRNYGCFGNAISEKNDLNKAKEYYKIASELSREITDIDRRYEGVWVGDLGNVEQTIGNNSAAEECFKKAIKIADDWKDTMHRSWWRGILGKHYHKTGRLVEACELIEYALKIAREAFDNRNIFTQLEWLSQLYIDQKDFKSAVSVLMELSDRYQEKGDNKRKLEYCRRASDALFLSGEYRKAIALNEEVLIEETKNKKWSQMILDSCALSEKYVELGRNDLAVPHIEKAYTVWKNNEAVNDKNLLLLPLIEGLKRAGKGDMADRLLQAEFENMLSFPLDNKINDPSDVLNSLEEMTGEDGNEDTSMLLQIIEGLKRAGKGDMADRLNQAEFENMVSFPLDNKINDLSDVLNSLEEILVPPPGVSIDDGITDFTDVLKTILKERTQKKRGEEEEFDDLECSGVEAYKNENYKIAIEIFSQGIELSKKRGNWEKEVKFRMLLARVMIRIENFKEANMEIKISIQIIKDYGSIEAAESYRPMFYGFYFSEIRKLLDKGDIEGVKDLGSEAISIIPESADVQKRFGQLFLSGGRQTKSRTIFELGIQAFTNAINIDPNDSLVFEERATSYALTGQLDLAIKDYETTIRLDSKNTSSILSKMEVEIWLGRYSDARGTYWKNKSQLKSKRDQIVGAWLICTALTLDGMEFSEYLGQLNNPNIKLSEEMWGINDINPYFKKLKASGLPKERLQNALKLYRLFKSKFIPVEDIESQLKKRLELAQKTNKALSLFDNKKFELALKECNDIIEIDSNVSSTYKIRGEIYYSMWNHSRNTNELLDIAISDFSAAISIDQQLYQNDVPQVITNLGLVPLFDGHFDIIFDHYSDLHEVYQKRGNLLAHRGRFEESIADYSKAIELNSSNTSAILSKMEIEIWLGRFSDARQTLDLEIAKKTLLSPQKRLIWAYFYCVSCIADGMDYKGVYCLVQDDLIHITKELYNPENMEKNFINKSDSNIPNDCRKGLENLHKLFLDHYNGTNGS